GKSNAPAKISDSNELQAQLKLQDEATQALLAERHRLGALSFDRVEAQAVVSDGKVSGITAYQKNRATELIEDFMIAVNESMARALVEAGVPTLPGAGETPEGRPP